MLGYIGRKCVGLVLVLGLTILTIIGSVSANASVPSPLNVEGSFIEQDCRTITAQAVNLQGDVKSRQVMFMVVDRTTRVVLGTALRPSFEDDAADWLQTFTLPQNTGTHQLTLEVDGRLLDEVYVNTDCSTGQAMFGRAVCENIEGWKSGLLAVNTFIDNRRSHVKQTFKVTFIGRDRLQTFRFPVGAGQVMSVQMFIKPPTFGGRYFTAVVTQKGHELAVKPFRTSRCS